MSDCAQFREQREDVALGAVPAPAFASHLAGCPACAQDVDRQRALARRLDTAIQALVRAEPPAELFTGVAARLEAARPPRGWNPRRLRPAAFAAVAVCALVAGLGWHALERPPVSSDPGLAALSAWRSPTASLLEPLEVPSQSQMLPHPTSGATHDS
jgi:anti-sigma factor RsiW